MVHVCDRALSAGAVFEEEGSLEEGCLPESVSFLGATALPSAVVLDCHEALTEVQVKPLTTGAIAPSLFRQPATSPMPSVPAGLADPPGSDPQNLLDSPSEPTESDIFSLPDAEPPQTPGREPVRLLVIGSRRGVMNTIRTLYRLGFAAIDEWSPLLPGPNPGEVMSILTRFLPAES